MEMTPDSEPYRTSWAVSDLIAFGSFFVLSLMFLPSILVMAVRLFIPGISIATLSSEAQILLQGALDVAWVGFIFFLVKVIHRRPILESIHWIRTNRFRTGSLIALGATLALAVFVVSSFFPPATPPAIEKLVESSKSLYLLVIFGIVFAPIIEEIMFRAFFFNALYELGGSRLAVPATAVLFALLHAPQLWPSLAGIVLIFVVGFVLSFVRDRSNSLIPSFIIHTAYNGMLVGASALGTLLQRGK